MIRSFLSYRPTIGICQNVSLSIFFPASTGTDVSHVKFENPKKDHCHSAHHELKYVATWNMLLHLIDLFFTYIMKLSASNGCESFSVRIVGVTSQTDTFLPQLFLSSLDVYPWLMHVTITDTSKLVMDERSLRMYGVDCTVWRGSRCVWTIHKGNRKETSSDILTVMSSLCNQNLSINTDLHAANGKRVKALDIFAYALAFFKEQALKVTHVFCSLTHAK